MDGCGGGSDGEKRTLPEGEGKVKRKMKTASQLEILEKTYAVETYPSEVLRAELSVKLGLSDRQLQMWFCHRRLKDRKAPPSSAKRPRQDEASLATAGGNDVVVGNEQESGSGSGLSPVRHVEIQQQQKQHLVLAPRGGAGATAVGRIGADMPALKRYYEPPQAISELRAISFVEAQLGETLREDGPILGMEFDPLPPGAFGAPIVTAGQRKPAGRPYEANFFERPDAKLVKGASRAPHEYQFLPEQPSVRKDPYERAVPSHYYISSSDAPSTRTPLTTGRPFVHGIEQVPSGFGFQNQLPSLNLLPQQGRQGHLLPSVSGDYDIVPRKNSFVNIVSDAQFGPHPISGLDNTLTPPDGRVSQEDENLRMERKRKSEDARMAREVEAHEKRIRKELEKQDILRRKREEQMKKEMERQDRERRKEEERLLREKQREEERYQREQRREMERREKFLQKESIRAEKLKLKEEMRREKDAARIKAANERATARRIAKEAMELLDDERVELMDLAASRKGLPSILSLDSDALQDLELFRDMLTEFPPKSVSLKRPFTTLPWTGSEENIGNLLMVWRFLISFADVLGLWPFTLDEFVQAFHDYDSRLLGEVHVALLRSIIKDIEDVARTPSTGLGTSQNTSANPGGGHPQIVEGAYAWGFDIRSWQCHLNPLTWPEILRQFALSAGLGPKLKKRSVDQPCFRDENEGNTCEDIILKLRNGAAAENALAVMQERGFSNPRKSRHRLTPGTVKFAAFHVLSIEGSKGLTILDVAEKIQKSGLRDLTTSKTPEASIAAALSRDTKLFERTAPSTYCVRSPYRKDPIDAVSILSAAREKIQVFKNGYFDGEDADDAERDDVEREEDSESDVAEDPEADDLGTELKPNKDDLSCEVSSLQAQSCSGIGKDSSPHVVVKVSQGGIGNTSSLLTPMQYKGLQEVKTSGAAVNRSIDDAGIHNEATKINKEDTVIDENNSGEAWVQGLVLGDYSDLSVEERLDALVALINVANEGNSIRIVLEERLEAANALKKQMWAESQVDKRRMKEEFVMKMQYSSFIGNKAEQNLSISALEGRQSPFFHMDEKNDLVSTNPVVQQEQMGDPRNDLNYPNNLPAERNLLMQEFSSGPEQAGHAAEKSRSQFKAFIGHKAEQMYEYRSLPLGQDRRCNRYWQFITSASCNDPGSGRIFVELHDGRWRLIDSEESFDALLGSLDVRGVRESHLHSMFQRIEVSFKDTVRNNSFSSGRTTENTIRREFSGSASNPKCSASIESPSSSACALKRYQEFEKWMWEECLISSILCAVKFGKPRCKQLLKICDFCRIMYLSGDNHCPFCHSTYEASVSNLDFSEHVAQCNEKLKGEAGWTLHNAHSFPPLRIRLLKAQLSSMEVSVLLEALQPSWSDEYRKSWGMKLHMASSAEDLLQILTLLEAALRRDFLSSDYETTTELLGSCNLTECMADTYSSRGTLAVLPWLPQTSSSVALRLMELDASIFYSLSQKENSQKDKGASDVARTPSRYPVVKLIPEDGLAEAPYEAGSLHQEPWVDPVSGHTSLGGGRGRGRGRSRGRGGRSQKRATGSRSEAAQRSTTSNTERFGQLPAWKGRTRGRGGRRRGRRMVRSRLKPVKRVTEEVGNRDYGKGIIYENTPRSSSQANWDMEEATQLQVECAESASSSERSEYDDENGPPLADEYDDIVLDTYPGGFTRKPEHLREHVDYGDEEDGDVNEEDGGDDDDDDDDDDEKEDIDVDGYFKGESDEEEIGDTSGKQFAHPDEFTGSSSSEYSD